MSNNDKMLQLVLSDNALSSYYKYDADEYPTIEEGLRSKKPIVVAVSKIIDGISSKSDRSAYKETYNDVVNYLNLNII